MNRSVFGFDELSFANEEADDVPETGANVIVLRTTGDPFGAGTAANLIADRITESGPGFFIYFNSGLQLPRLVFSTDLSDNTADLKVLARITNLQGPAGFDALAGFEADNFEQVPEPATTLTTGLGALVACCLLRRRRVRG